MVDPTARLTAQEEKDLNKFQKFFSYKVCLSYMYVCIFVDLYYLEKF